MLFPLPADPELVAPPLEKEHASIRHGNGQKIWILDDEAAIARLYGDLLDAEGYQVRLFTEPIKLLTAFANEDAQFDLLICDQTMPGMTGSALADFLHGMRPSLPIILCTGYRDKGHTSNPLSPATERHFTKPVNANALLQAVSEMLNHA